MPWQAKNGTVIYFGQTFVHRSKREWRKMMESVADKRSESKQII